jgi:hypothetical protein
MMQHLTFDILEVCLASAAGRCGCGSHEIAYIGLDKETSVAMELWCVNRLLELRKKPFHDPGKVWHVIYPPVETTIKTVAGINGRSWLPTQRDDRGPPATPAD